jgi:hypothetical protein
MPRNVKVLIGPIAGLVQEALQVKIMHLMVQVARQDMTIRALAFAKEDLLASQLRLSRFRFDKPARDNIDLGRRRKIEHVLHLRHVADLDVVQNVHAFLDGMNFVAVEVCGALLEFGEVFDRTQTTFRAVNLLIEYAAQTYSVQTEAAFFWPYVRV